jgi:autotransporter strand-loop-strand O-heptosyltransferase
VAGQHETVSPSPPFHPIAPLRLCSHIEEKMKPQFDINFIDGPYLYYRGGDDAELRVDFIDHNTGIVNCSDTIKIGESIKIDTTYFIDWQFKFYKDDRLVFKKKFNCRKKRVYIAIESGALGDTLAWIPYLEAFRQKHQCTLIASTFHNYLFEKEYPDIEFVKPGDTVYDLYAMYRIGLFYTDNQVDLKHNLTDFKSLPLQQAASDILGLPAIEIKPKVQLIKGVKKEKLITIALHGSAQAKYWNNKTGWQEVIDYIIQKGYRVKLLSRERDNHMGNKHPTGISQLDSGSLAEVTHELQKSVVFIGIGSGLSWMSWAIGTPTILISGFSEKFSEFKSNTYRIAAPAGACSGCFNKVRLDAANWNWCPEHEKTERQFECTKLISAQSVIDQLAVLLGETPLSATPPASLCESAF